MEERLTDQVPGAVESMPDIPSSPAQLFGPLSVPKVEPGMTAASVPPSSVEGATMPVAATVAAAPPATPADAAAARQRGWPKFVAIGVVAVLLGALVGWFAGTPQRNDLTTQRNDALAQVDTLTADLDATKASLADTKASLTDTQAMLTEATDGLAATKADLESATAQLTAMTSAKNIASTQAKACETAATTASDLVGQWENMFNDVMDFWGAPYGSAAEAQLQTHIDEQFQKMEEQQVALDRSMGKCIG